MTTTEAAAAAAVQTKAWLVEIFGEVHDVSWTGDALVINDCDVGAAKRILERLGAEPTTTTRTP